jgi:hypothetical protein
MISLRVRDKSKRKEKRGNESRNNNIDVDKPEQGQARVVPRLTMKEEKMDYTNLLMTPCRCDEGLQGRKYIGTTTTTNMLTGDAAVAW